jgi:hypothetical protein
MENDLIFETETGDMLSGTDGDEMQIAAVTSPAAAPVDDVLPRPFDAAQVVVPEGAAVVRIPVAPGEFVELPFPADAHFLARIDNGNLAIKVGDITVILQGYVEAAGQTPPVIEAANGHPLDIATILAATDLAIDIQTAVGPSTQGQGADNTGAFFQQVGEAGGLGGFQGTGAQDGTDGVGGGADGVGAGSTGRTVAQFQEVSLLAVEPNIAPTSHGGYVLIMVSEDTADKLTLPLGWVVTDPDDAGHTITIDPATLPLGVSYDSKTETLELDIKHKYDYLKASDTLHYTLTFTITDDRGASSERDLPLRIIGANDAPVAYTDWVVVDGGAASATLPLWTLAANDGDIEGDALHTSTLKDVPVFGDETIVVFIPPGESTMGYTVSDWTIDSGPVAMFYKHDAVADGDITGTEGREILLGTAAKETLDGGGGDDIVAGNGGGDEIFGGAGDDTLVFSAGSMIHGQTDEVPSQGGLATDADKHGDILAFGDAKLDFSDHVSVAGLDGIETISMQAKLGGFTAQSLTIGAHSVQDLSDHTITPGGIFTEHEAVRIDGDVVDQLYLSISKDGGSWTDTGVVTNGYSVYAHETAGGDPATTDAYVMVSAAIPAGNVHLNQDQP